MEYALNSISSLLFLVPFVITALIIWPKEIKMPVSQIWLWIATTLGLISAILTGRKMVWLVLLISPFIILTFYFISGSLIKPVIKKV